MKKKHFRNILLLAGVWSLLAASLFGYDYEESIEKQFPIGPAGILKLININGNINISSHTKPGIVVIETMKMADDRGEFNKLSIDFLSDGENVTVLVKKIDDSCQAAVNFNVKVPDRGISVDCLTILGNITAKGDYGKIKCKTVNGTVDFTGNFVSADFNSVSDKISIDIKDDVQGELKARSYNGDIELELPASASFKVLVTAVNGKIKNEFGLTPQELSLGWKLEGIVGDGKGQISLTSQNGAVAILKK